MGIMTNKKYFILSLKRQHDHGLFFWTDHAKGYTTNIAQADQFSGKVINDHPQRYNDGISAMAIPCEDLIKMLCPGGNPFAREL